MRFPEASIGDTEAERAARARLQSVFGTFQEVRFEIPRIAVERREGYTRKATCDGWKRSGGKSTRQWVLEDEALPEGGWYSAFDDVTTTISREFDIDHMVPCAEAWESGGHRWTSDTWTRYANDLGDPRSLIAVSASSNRSKSKRDPAEWWPPRAAYRCEYAVNWIAVKVRWSLTMDTDELFALDVQLGGCDQSEFEGFREPEIACVVYRASETGETSQNSACGR